MDTRDIQIFKQDIQINITLRGFPMTFYSTWGLFSPREIDEGSALIISSVQVAASDEILDLGCGYGAIGLTLAKLAPHGKIHLVDKDYVAIDYTKKNVRINHIYNCEIYLSNGFSNIPDVQFDTIVSNLPAKAGKEFFWILLDDAKKHLKPGGKIYVVTISGLKNFIKKNFIEFFGNYEKIDHSKTYIVSMAYKP